MSSMRAPKRSMKPLFRTLLLGPLGLVIVVTIACSGDDEDTAVTRARLASSCSLDSDCADPLVCAFSACHTQCNDTRDCPIGQRCVASDKPFHVCQLPNEVECATNTQCKGGQICGRDNKCRDACTTDRDCVALQVCSGNTCAEPSEVVSGVVEAGSGQACSYTSECAEPLVCRNNICAIECTSSRDCAGGAACVESRCRGAGPGATCALNSQCAGDLICVRGTCVVECMQDKDCVDNCPNLMCPPLYCDVAAHRCRSNLDGGTSDGSTDGSTDGPTGG